MEHHVLHRVSHDRLDRFLTESETEIGRIRATHLAALAEIDRRQVPTGT